MVADLVHEEIRGTLPQLLYRRLITRSQKAAAETVRIWSGPLKTMGDPYRQPSAVQQTMSYGDRFNVLQLLDFPPNQGQIIRSYSFIPKSTVPNQLPGFNTNQLENVAGNKRQFHRGVTLINNARERVE